MYFDDKSNIPFTREQYKKVDAAYKKWWNNELDRPIVQIMIGGNPSKREPSKYTHINFMTAWDFNITPEQFIDWYDWSFSHVRYYGEAFPRISMTGFGPGSAATFMGCTPQSRPETVWFLPDKKLPIEELHFEFDPNNKYLRRVINIYEAAMEKWHGAVVIDQPDLGGVLDILASFIDAEDLACEMIDSPDEVLRCVNEIQEMWIKYFDLFADIMKPEACGHSHWYGLYHEKPSYIMQSDFSYMISPQMFDLFVAPELKKTAEHMENAVYHLDGVGELPHLDSLLKIDAIKGIQWEPGDGETRTMNWDHVLKKIMDGGKKNLAYAENADWTLRDVVKNPNMVFTGVKYFNNDKDGIEKAKRFADMYGIELDV